MNLSKHIENRAESAPCGKSNPNTSYTASVSDDDSIVVMLNLHKFMEYHQ